MSVLIPYYLNDISSKIRETKNEVEIKIVCSCGCQKFTIFQNLQTELEKKNIQDYERLSKKYNEFIRDEIDGKLYAIHRNFIGKIIDKIEYDKLPPINNLKILKSKCNSCGQEYTLFDNRLYGYDAKCHENLLIEDKVNYKQIAFKGSKENIIEIKMKIQNDLSYEKYKSETDLEVTLKDYSESFSSISIYGYICELENKKKLIYFEETS